jgi:hypothetical protein
VDSGWVCVFDARFSSSVFARIHNGRDEGISDFVDLITLLLLKLCIAGDAGVQSEAMRARILLD